MGLIFKGIKNGFDVGEKRDKLIEIFMDFVFSFETLGGCFL